MTSLKPLFKTLNRCQVIAHHVLRQLGTITIGIGLLITLGTKYHLVQMFAVNAVQLYTSKGSEKHSILSPNVGQFNTIDIV